MRRATGKALGPLLFVVAILLGLRPALAQADAAAEALGQSLLSLGEQDEAAGAFARAIEHDRACIAASPGSRAAELAADRIAWLTERAEGDFAPLARLERLRRDPVASNDPAAIAALANDMEAFPPGRVRTEARMVVADAWLNRIHRPRDAVAPLRRLVDDPRTDPTIARYAERQLVGVLRTTESIDSALGEARRGQHRLDRQFVIELERLARRRILRGAAVAELGLFGALAGVAIVRAGRTRPRAHLTTALRRFAPTAAAFTAYLAVIGGMLASNYEQGAATPFLLLGAAALPLVLIARAWGAVGSPRPAARALRAIIAGVSVLSAAFVLLSALDSTYLDGFGL